jgi:hypothetical protein
MDTVTNTQDGVLGGDGQHHEDRTEWLLSFHSTAKGMPEAVGFYSADTIAECFDGISMETSAALWNGSENMLMSEVWPTLTPAQQAEVAAAVAADEVSF